MFPSTQPTRRWSVSKSVGGAVDRISNYTGVRSTRGQGSPGFFCFDIGGLWDDLGFRAAQHDALIRRGGTPFFATAAMHTSLPSSDHPAGSDSVSHYHPARKLDNNPISCYCVFR